jgi:multidrug efflux pump subunit AcrB
VPAHNSGGGLDILMVVFMLSPDDSLDQLYISNYALLQVRDQLLRLDSIGDIQIFGARDYSMRHSWRLTIR